MNSCENREKHELNWIKWNGNQHEIVINDSNDMLYFVM